MQTTGKSNMIDRRAFMGATGTGALLIAAGSGNIPVKRTRDDLNLLASPREGEVALLTEKGREGIFVFREGDFSEQIASDPLEGIFVQSPGEAGSTMGCWIRTFEGAIMVDWFGAAGDGTTDDSAAIRAAIMLASSIAGQSKLDEWSSLAFVDVGFRGGAVYHLAKPVTIPTAVARFHLVGVGGHACLVGDEARATKGLIFKSLRSTIFKRLNFAGFSTATEWDTDNTDTSHIKYIDCEWSDCDIGVDTVSYEGSRSTVLLFDRCRTGSGVKRWVESYCDMVVFDDVHVRSGAGDRAFVRGDSQIIVRGGIWTPYVVSTSANPREGARWFDVHDACSYAEGDRPIASRSLTIDGAARFGPENGGYPIVCSFLRGDTAKGRRLGPHISIGPGVFAACTGLSTPRQLIILMEVETDGSKRTSFPNSIQFEASAWRAVSGAIGKESKSRLGVGLENIGSAQIAFTFSPGAVRTIAIRGEATRNRLVEDELEPFVADWHGMARR